MTETKAGNSLKCDNAGIRMFLLKDNINEVYYIGKATLNEVIKVFGDNYKTLDGYKLWTRTKRSHIILNNDNSLLICSANQFKVLRHLPLNDYYDKLNTIY